MSLLTWLSVTSSGRGWCRFSFFSHEGRGGTRPRTADRGPRAVAPNFCNGSDILTLYTHAGLCASRVSSVTALPTRAAAMAIGSGLPPLKRLRRPDYASKQQEATCLGCTLAHGRRPVCTLQDGSTRTSLACLGDVGRVRIGPVRTDPPSIRTRRDKVRPTARAHGNDNAPCSVVKLRAAPLRRCIHEALRLTCHGFVQKAWFAAIRAL